MNTLCKKITTKEKTVYKKKKNNLKTRNKLKYNNNTNNPIHYQHAY